MKLRTWLAGSATLLIAVQGFAAQKMYTADGDQSTKFPTDRRVYRGDCDPDAATPNAGDDGLRADDQCTCTPGTVKVCVGGTQNGNACTADSFCAPGGGDCSGGCQQGFVPWPRICVGGTRASLNCTVASDCPGGGACTLQTTSPDNCNGSEGRPNGGACDPNALSSKCSGGTNNGANCSAESQCTGGGHCSGACGPNFNTHGSPEPPCNATTGGGIVIEDSIPRLVSMVLQAEFDDFVGASTITAIPGSTVELHAENTITISPNQTGTYSGSTINWGSLTGWTQTGRLFCQTTCPGGCGLASGCKPFVGFDGLGPPAPLKATSFNTDPWVFTGDEFTANSFEIVSLGLGAVTAAIQPGGRLISIPALPLAALGGLGAGLVYLGARALGRKRD